MFLEILFDLITSFSLLYNGTYNAGRMQVPLIIEEEHQIEKDVVQKHKPTGDSNVIINKGQWKKPLYNVTTTRSGRQIRLTQKAQDIKRHDYNF